MKICLMVLSVLISLSVFAKPAKDRRPASGNSSWLLCKPKKKINAHDDFLPVVMLYSHRDGDNWKSEVYINYGAYLMTGSFVEDDQFSGKVDMKSVQQPGQTLFAGTVATNYQSNTVTLKGSSSITGEAKNYSFVLPCETLN